jgi:Fic family protein
MSDEMTIKEKASRFWADKTKNNEYIVVTNDLPEQRQREYLVKEKYLSLATRGYWILKRPEDDLEEVFPLLYWQLIEKILSRYGSSIRGNSALLIYSGAQEAQKHLLVRTKEKTNRKITMPFGYDITLTHDSDFDDRLVKEVKVTDRNIPVDIPEKVLIDIARRKPNKNSQSFIAGTKFDLRILEILYADNPKPIVFKRIIGLAKDVNRFDLVSGIEKTIETYTHYRVGKKEKIRPVVTEDKTVALNPPWVIRQETQIKEFEKLLEKKLSAEIKKLKKHSLEQLLKQARDHKKYDTYHSTTLEGYRITPEEVESLLSGIIPKSEKKKGNDYLEEIKNRMAITGYSEAFDFIVKIIQADFAKAYINEKIVQDTYYYLFKPSADAGIIDRRTLITYRNIPAYIRGVRHVPPAYEKLPELMASFESVINKIDDPIVKAILAHYLFVTIHPYIDGNGRTARLLMNYLLLTNGYPWITIRADQRIEYFESLKKAQVGNNILPFGKFIVRMIKSVG